MMMMMMVMNQRIYLCIVTICNLGKALIREVKVMIKLIQGNYITHININTYWYITM